MTDERTLPERLRELGRRLGLLYGEDRALRFVCFDAADALEAAEQPRIAAGMDELARQAVAHADALTKLRTAMEGLRRRAARAEQERDAVGRAYGVAAAESQRTLVRVRADRDEAVARVAELEAEAARAVVFEPVDGRPPRGSRLTITVNRHEIAKAVAAVMRDEQTGRG